jgi:hypothetical protein
MRNVESWPICALLLVLLSLLSAARPALAQADACTVQVYYGSGGQDEGDCLHSTGLCATKEYALQQGLNICAREVQILLDGFVVDTYRNPTVVMRSPLDWMILSVYWVLPWIIGAPIGWWAGRRLA